jgi:hypothetical protein
VTRFAVVQISAIVSNTTRHEIFMLLPESIRPNTLAA